MKTCSTLILAALCACGCGKEDDNKKSAKPPASEPATRVAPSVDKAEVSAEIAMPDPVKVEAYIKATIAAVEDAGEDCAKLAAPVVELTRQNADLLAELAAAAASDQSRQWRSENAELFAGFSTAMRAMAACSRQEPGLVEVLKILSPRRPQPPAAATTAE